MDEQIPAAGGEVGGHVAADVSETYEADPLLGFHRFWPLIAAVDTPEPQTITSEST